MFFGGVGARWSLSTLLCFILLSFFSSVSEAYAQGDATVLSAPRPGELLFWDYAENEGRSSGYLLSAFDPNTKEVREILRITPNSRTFQRMSFRTSPNTKEIFFLSRAGIAKIGYDTTGSKSFTVIVSGSISSSRNIYLTNFKIDVVNEKIYWLEDHVDTSGRTNYSAGEHFRRADLDGGNAETIVVSAASLFEHENAWDIDRHRNELVWSFNDWDRATGRFELVFRATKLEKPAGQVTYPTREILRLSGTAPLDQLTVSKDSNTAFLSFRRIDNSPGASPWQAVEVLHLDLESGTLSEKNSTPWEVYGLNNLRNSYDAESGELYLVQLEYQLSPTRFFNYFLQRFDPASGELENLVDRSGNTIASYGPLEFVRSVSDRIRSFSHTNPENHLDVNGDGYVSPTDALLLINRLNRSRNRTLRPKTRPDSVFLDVNADGELAPSDALIVINNLNGREAEGEGEGGLAHPLRSRAVSLDRAHRFYAPPWLLQMNYFYTFSFNTVGAKFFLGSSGWYFIKPNGGVYLWNGGFSQSTLLGTLDISYHLRPERLYQSAN